MEAQTSSSDGIVARDKAKLSPPHDLPLNLDLYNYDSSDAQSCPYVLTSPRSLEACSRVGIKPVDLLFKTLDEFKTDTSTEKQADELQRLYDEQEKHRIVLLKKCQAERDFIIWRTSPKPRSQSLSPCRRLCRNAKGIYTCTSIHATNLSAKSEENLSAFCDGGPRDVSSCHLRNSSVKNREAQPVCWSTPASPYFRGSSNLFVRITSPVVCAKLQSFPRNKMRLPPKEMKILEVMLQKYDEKEKDEQRRAKATLIWDREKEERDRRKEMAELDRWKALALKQRRCCSEERSKAEDSESSSSCSKQSGLSTEKQKKSKKRHSFKCPKNQRDATERSYMGGGRMSRYDADQKLKEIRLREKGVERRRQEIILKRDDELKRSAEELREKIRQVKTNQQELDKSMEKWQEQVIDYQYACNVRAAEKATELSEQRRSKVKNERLNRQAEHKKNMKRLEAEEYAKLQEMMEKLRSKDERSRAFVQEKHSSIEQSRQLAQAASDLRDLIRQKLDKHLFLNRSKQAMLESRLLCLQPHERAVKSQEHLDEEPSTSSS